AVAARAKFDAQGSGIARADVVWDVRDGVEAGELRRPADRPGSGGADGRGGAAGAVFQGVYVGDDAVLPDLLPADGRGCVQPQPLAGRSGALSALRADGAAGDLWRDVW